LTPTISLISASKLHKKRKSSYGKNFSPSAPSVNGLLFAWTKCELSTRKVVNKHRYIMRFSMPFPYPILPQPQISFTSSPTNKPPQELQTLNTSLHDIELAVSLGRERSAASATTSGPEEPSPPALSVLLKNVANQVSTKSAQGGILKSVREFNAFLERAAGALEKGTGT
jgi:hypothetical protein